MNFLKLFSSLGRAKPIGSLTDFLVGNDAFRYLAQSFHLKKQKAARDLEQYLDKELLGRQPVKQEVPLQVNTKGRNTSTQSRDHQKFDHKF